MMTLAFAQRRPSAWRKPSVFGPAAVVWIAALCALAGSVAAASGATSLDAVRTGNFAWTVSPPLIGPAQRRDDPCHAIKDPSVVHFEGRWHLFCTIRSRHRTHQIEYLCFTDWGDADAAPRHVLRLHDGYCCAPQVFWFTPHRRWYLVHQMSDPSRRPALQPAFSTSTNLANPTAWTKPELLFAAQLPNVERWIDFWVICDDTHAHLFFTSLDGRMWRAQTPLAQFPHGWSLPTVALHGDVFEASHTYRLKGLNQYLTVIEAQDGARRYYKAYLADRLDGEWRPLAASRDKPFASPRNCRDRAAHWTDSFSHGELLRAGYDERLEVDPADLRFLFQGVADTAMAGKSYGDIPWRLGLLEPAE
jgi:hypothetical protein